MSLTFKLDDAPPQPSLTVEDLNAELVKMRKVVNTAKVIVFRDLLRYIKRLRAKLSSQPFQSRLKQKLIHRESELSLLRELSVNRVCKLLLANEYGKSELAFSGHQLTPQDRLITRLAATKPVHNYVERFRQDHSDWKSLTHYLLYKNISGKWKSREQKKRNRKVRGSLPLPPAPTDSVQDPDRPTDTEFSINHEAYRVPKAPSTDEDLPDGSSPRPAPVPDPSADLDSDAASDIADDLVQRILQKRQNPSSSTHSELHESTDHSLATAPTPEDSEANQTNPIKSIMKRDSSVKEKQNLKKQKKQKKPVEVRFSLPEKPESTSAHEDEPASPAKPSTLSEHITELKVSPGKWNTSVLQKQSEKRAAAQSDVFGNAKRSKPEEEPVAEIFDDENPLGSDDVGINRRLASRAEWAARKRQPSNRGGRPGPRDNSFSKYGTRQRSSAPRKMTGKFGAQITVPSSASAKDQLHPSWQAKLEQKLKANLNRTAPSSVSAPKHIVFED